MTVLVVDIDGTYVRGNTLKVFARVALQSMLRHGRIRDFALGCSLLALRQLRLITHTRMKFALLRYVDFSDPQLRDAFKHRVEKHINPTVKALVDSHLADGKPVLFATAAAAEYVGWIVTQPYVATPIAGNTAQRECRGADKLEAVRAFIAEHHPGADFTVVTDHYDDLPLMAAARRTILISPSPRTRMIVAAAGIRVG